MSDSQTLAARVYLGAALALTFLMPSSDSLWIDEAQTWKSAVIPNFGAWFHALRTNPFSEALMPLGMFVAWVSAKLIGTSEWQLRAINILWTSLGTIAFWQIGKALRAPWAPLLFAVQPFVWFYANEARPYSLQISCGAWLLAGLVIGIEQRLFSLGPLLMIGLAGIALVGSTLFGILTVAAVVIVVAGLVRSRRVSISRDWLWIGGLLLGGSILFGLYYLVPLQRGAVAARLWPVGPANVGFSLYEFMGFAGLGPPRDELRELAQSGGLSSVLRRTLPYAPWQLLLACFLTFSLWGAFRRANDEIGRSQLIAKTAVIGAVWTETVTLAVIAHFPFWGRHLAPSFAFYLGILVVGGASGGRSSGRVPPTIVCVLALLLLASSLRLRFASEHRKDDYRSAARIALDAVARGESVWWVADPDAAAYYGVKFSDIGDGSHSVRSMAKSDADKVSIQQPPGIIILSKPEAYDDAHAVRDKISVAQYEIVKTLKTFSIWEPAAQRQSAP
jgi:hypothetical protein